MKKKILSICVATALVVVAGYGVMNSVNNSNAGLNDLAKANIEALANDEWTVPVTRDCGPGCSGGYCGTIVWEGGSTTRLEYCN
jgi:hypothetical protein